MDCPDSPRRDSTSRSAPLAICMSRLECSLNRARSLLMSNLRVTASDLKEAFLMIILRNNLMGSHIYGSLSSSLYEPSELSILQERRLPERFILEDYWNIPGQGSNNVVLRPLRKEVSPLMQLFRWMNMNEVEARINFGDNRQVMVKLPGNEELVKITDIPFNKGNNQYLYRELHRADSKIWMMILERGLAIHFSSYRKLHQLSLNKLFEFVMGVAVPTNRTLSVDQLAYLYYKRDYFTDAIRFDIPSLASVYYKFELKEKTTFTLALEKIDEKEAQVEDTQKGSYIDLFNTSLIGPMKIKLMNEFTQSKEVMEIISNPSDASISPTRVAYTDLGFSNKTLFEDFITLPPNDYIIHIFSRNPSTDNQERIKKGRIMYHSSSKLNLQFRRQYMGQVTQRMVNSMYRKELHTRSENPVGWGVMSNFVWDCKEQRGFRGILCLKNTTENKISLRIKLKNREQVVFQIDPTASFLDVDISTASQQPGKEYSLVKFIRLKNQQVGSFFEITKNGKKE